MQRAARRLAATALVATVAAPEVAAQDGPVAFVNATVVDVERGVLLPRQTILISRGRIDEVGPSATTRVPRGATRVDVAGRFVIPGLWDMHVHIGGVTADVGTSVGYYGSLFLANGVTNVRDAGGDGARLVTMDSIGRSRPGSMPRMVYAREKVGPAPDQSWSADDVRRAVTARVEAGAQFIKLTPGFPTEFLPAALEACDSARLLCVAHVPPGDTGLWFARRGRGSYEHLFNLAEQVSRVPAAELFAGAREFERPKLWQRVLYKLRMRQRPEEPILQVIAVRDTTRDRAFFGSVASAGIWMTPTLILHQQIFPFAALLPASLDTTLAIRPVTLVPRTPAQRDVERRKWELWTGVLRSMHAAGVPLLAGTDFSGRHVPGAVLHAELALLQQEGVPAAEVLRMATINPARYFGATDTLGTVAAGRVADLVVLRSNPLEDVRHVAGVEMVMTRGHLLRRTALDSLTSTARISLTRLRAAMATARGPGGN